jgi:hypothetical protein
MVGGGYFDVVASVAGGWCVVVVMGYEIGLDRMR